jgi:hypothetical protein
MNYEDKDPNVQAAIEKIAKSVRQEEAPSELITAWGLSEPHVSWVLNNIGMLAVIAGDVASRDHAAVFALRALDGLPPHLVVAAPEVALPEPSEVNTITTHVIKSIAHAVPRYVEDLTGPPEGENQAERTEWMIEAFDQVDLYRQREQDAALNSLMVTAVTNDHEIGQMTASGVPEGVLDFINEQVDAALNHESSTS